MALSHKPQINPEEGIISLMKNRKTTKILNVYIKPYAGVSPLTPWGCVLSIHISNIRKRALSLLCFWQYIHEYNQWWIMSDHNLPVPRGWLNNSGLRSLGLLFWFTSIPSPQGVEAECTAWHIRCTQVWNVCHWVSTGKTGLPQVSPMLNRRLD